MNFNNYTIKTQEVVQQAVQLALQHDQQAVENAHVLKALLAIDENVTPFILKKLSVNENMLTSALAKIIQSYPKVQGGEPHLSKNANQSLAYATNYMNELKDEFVSIEHLLLGLVKNTNDATSQLMRDAGFTTKELLKAITELRAGSNVNSQTADETYNALNKFAVNLNKQAIKGKLDPVIGRDEEIRSVLQILSRRTKNNPMLVGEPGVGKTAIAEGLAHRIVNGDVPENLKSKQLFSLDMGALIAGAKFKGEFEERLKSVVKEVTNSNGEIILFIDEIHTLVGAGGGEGAMDAANILKPALARGELRAIGATTLNEYQKYFEKDKALERRFQKIMVDEPNADDAIAILRGLKDRYESHHKVRIKDDAIIACVELSQRYITDRFLPDKAIDLMDEAASKLRMEINSMPVALDDLERKIRMLEIEREAIRRENDTIKLAQLAEEIANVSHERDNIKAKWLNEKQIVENLQTNKQKIEALKIEADAAERSGDYAKVAEIRYSKIGECETEIAKYSAEVEVLKASGSMLIKEEVDTDDIAAAVSRWTGIPVNRMLQSEREKLLNLETELHRRVVGQHEAIEAISNAIRRSRSGMGDPKRPIGSFIFLGTTGVGKTELAKALAEYLFNSDTALVRIDMSEYQERHSVSRLVGAPPGYVGYDEGGQLTEAVRRKNYSVVLLDEIEKAHPDVFNILLQVLDDGRLTDNKGRVVNFKNTIIIMTSNIGAHIIQEQFDELNDLSNDEEKAQVQASTKVKVYELLRQTIRPEFLNRIDDVVMFEPLGREYVKEIVTIQLNEMQKMLSKNDISISFTNEAIDWIAQLGYDPQYGARPVKRVIQKQVSNELAKLLLSAQLNKNEAIVLDCFDNKLVFRKEV
ncbi:MAG: ATP-dependent chaperone ClpB [Bacteroidia bacterium]